jgi:hypothetical protein
MRGVARDGWSRWLTSKVVVNLKYKLADMIKCASVVI